MVIAYQSCIEACLRCADACDRCAAACLKEKHIQMLANCIQLDLECSAICKTSVQYMHLESNHANTLCQLCADICTACAEECEKHEHEHCRECAVACRRCAEECVSMAAA